MNVRSATSYDLGQAQQILNNFFPPAAGIIQREQSAEEAPNYLKLSREYSASPESRTAAQSVAASPASGAETAHHHLSSWEECVAWCMDMTRAEAVFAADSQGFVIASRGNMPPQGFEGAGAELICSIEQLERIAPDAGTLLWLDLDFSRYRVAGFITPLFDSEYYVIGLIAPDAASYRACKRLMTETILGNLPHLD